MNHLIYNHIELSATAEAISDTVKNMTYTMKLLTIWLFVISLGLSTTTSGYDGDVDYSAPYITVDPETGKLVTIDPKAQQQQQAQHEATSPAAGSSAQSNQVMGQAATDSPITASGADQTSSSSMTPLLIGIVVLVLASVIVVGLRRSKPGSDTGSDTATGS